MSPSHLHELKSPLTAAKLGLQLVEEELRLCGFENQEILELIKQVSDKLTEVADKLDSVKDLLADPSITRTLEVETK